MKRVLRLTACLLGLIAMLSACGDSPEQNDGDDTVYSLHEALQTSRTLYARTEEVVYDAPFLQGTGATQGGCLIEDTFYQVFLRQDVIGNDLNNEDYIAKIDIKTGEVLFVSEMMHLNHANDMTYNTKKDVMVVCNATPRKNIITYLSMDDLHFIEEQEIDREIYSLTYNAAMDQYAVGIANGKSFYMADGDFQPVSEVFDPTTRTLSHTTQGVTSDDKYIYFVLYNPNAISVYDWDGNFVSLIHLGISPSIEPENITVVGDEMYIGTNGDSFKIFRVTNFVPEE